VGPGAGLETEARGKIFLPLPGIEPRSPGRPVRSQTVSSVDSAYSRSAQNAQMHSEEIETVVTGPEMKVAVMKY
jgi:hypothetical protein